MPSSLLSPRCLPSAVPGERRGGLDATSILDWGSPEVAQLAARLPTGPASAARAYLVRVHQAIASAIRPVYALNDLQPVSTTIRRGRGSCSQRPAVLEALARRGGIPTRVRGLVVDGRFWYPRFRRARALIPERVILAWPEFQIDGSALSVSELYGSLGDMAACGVGFTNTGGETLFDAVGRTAVDWAGCTHSGCDLSGHVRGDLGVFGSRDELFAAHGQTLCWLAYAVGDPILGRRVLR